ncbi:bacillithiol system redox-active protein YtxJ [Gracilibacillus kekensis]|uniref:Bacillithiol system protein YtxJ n=1 Tax=Gracilibacillus kekensis TaxID=1027249 RepID=A0A1M7NL34_9BACI|nr:bacillithiol system redox-active protein YtxJ [Gracilibacillus kekensis]SHN04695.1 bacillithiol system protein YtxJ [Gracilibacillus kekensis]
MEITDIQTIEEFQSVVTNNNQMLLLKHSLTCPISDSANQAFQQFSEHTDTPLYRLYVQNARTLSDYIAKTHQIKHESPQAIKFEDGKPIWNASHFDITADNLKKMV